MTPILAQLRTAADSLASVQPHAPTIESALLAATEYLVAQDSLVDRLERELRDARADRDAAEARVKRRLEADVAEFAAWLQRSNEHLAQVNEALERTMGTLRGA